FSLPSGAFRKDISRIIELAEKLGTKFVTIYPPKLLDLSTTKWLEKIIPIAFKEHKVYLCVTNTPSKTMLGLIPEYSHNSLLDLRKLQNITLDTSNLVSKSEDLIRTLDLLGKSLK